MVIISTDSYGVLCLTLGLALGIIIGFVIAAAAFRKL
jgi:uncharacterized protein YneF (UPF0154 family)